MGATAKRDGLATPVRFLKGVGEVRAAQLARLNIETAGDLLFTLPRRYEDRRQLYNMGRLESGDFVTVEGTVLSCAWIRPRRGKGYFEAVLCDETGFVRCRWYLASYLQDQLKKGHRLVVYGKARKTKGQVILQHPDFEHATDEGEEPIHVGRIVPVYPLTDNLPQRTMRRIMWHAIQQFLHEINEVLPDETIQRWRLRSRRDAVGSIHFPESLEEARAARYRLAFEEFLCMQLVLVARKVQAERYLTGIEHRPEGRLRETFMASLPFTLTRAQQNALAEIRADMAKPRPMHRLLQGDVGSGKTVVAACALLDAIECGSQGAVMAPTEILATQHFNTFAHYLKPLGVTMTLLTSSLTPEEKISARASIADGRTNLVVGTHALIQERVVFKRLGLVVIDEQHKFGVEQRGLLYGKGEHPDVLVMTATPIPRTLAMTLYGDLDITTIKEMPGGRQPIVTRVISESQLHKAYDFIRKQVAAGRQAYIVYPLVSESDHVELRAAEAMYEQLREGVFNSVRLGLLHGQMPAARKDDVMRRFREGQLDVLVTTSVVEVGVDVPNATIMLVEHAERFGLAQLHQLRGRIGRGAHKSYCILQGAPGSRDAWRRLKVMEQTTDGFLIAEEDFKIRGMGNLLGREQSGVPMLRIGDPLADVSILNDARKEAELLVEQDPLFKNPAYEPLREQARRLYREAGPFVKVG